MRPSPTPPSLALLLCLGMLLSVGTLLGGCGGPQDPGPRLTGGVVYGGSGAAAVRAAFEAGRGRPRILALLSPT